MKHPGCHLFWKDSLLAHREFLVYPMKAVSVLITATTMWSLVTRTLFSQLKLKYFNSKSFNSLKWGQLCCWSEGKSNELVILYTSFWKIIQIHLHNTWVFLSWLAHNIQWKDTSLSRSFAPMGAQPLLMQMTALTLGAQENPTQLQSSYKSFFTPLPFLFMT